MGRLSRCVLCLLMEVIRMRLYVKMIPLFILISLFLITSSSAMDHASSRYEINRKMPDPVYRMDNKDKKQRLCYLTFDDGPSASSGKLMDLLNHYHANATFFLLGTHIIKYPESVKRMNQEGFTIGLHGISHDYKKLYRSEKSVVEEMKDDQRILMSVVTINTPFIRTPYGSYPFMKESYRRTVIQHGFIMWDWNVDSYDWRYKNWRFVQHTIKQIRRLTMDGQIPVILLHDRAYAYRYLEPLLKYLQQNNYEMKSIDASMHPLQFPEKW
jgi:Predicted xylanase/chitin deacetylase